MLPPLRHRELNPISGLWAGAVAVVRLPGMYRSAHGRWGLLAGSVRGVLALVVLPVAGACNWVRVAADWTRAHVNPRPVALRVRAPRVLALGAVVDKGHAVRPATAALSALVRAAAHGALSAGSGSTGGGGPAGEAGALRALAIARPLSGAAPPGVAAADWGALIDRLARTVAALARGGSLSQLLDALLVLESPTGDDVVVVAERAVLVATGLRTAPHVQALPWANVRAVEARAHRAPNHVVLVLVPAVGRRGASALCVPLSLRAAVQLRDLLWGYRL